VCCPQNFASRAEAAIDTGFYGDRDQEEGGDNGDELACFDKDASDDNNDEVQDEDGDGGKEDDVEVVEEEDKNEEEEDEAEVVDSEEEGQDEGENECPTMAATPPTVAKRNVVPSSCTGSKRRKLRY
jgi:hypothetical protein